MPLIKKIELKYFGEYKTFKIYFSEKSSFYVKEPPKELKFVNEQDTLQAMVRVLREAIDKLEESLKESRKVIMIDFCVGHDVVMTPTGGGGSCGNSSNPLYQFNRQAGYGFSINYIVADLVTKGREQEYYNYHPEPNGELVRAIYKSKLQPDDSFIIIDYSDERLEFCKGVQASMLAMMLKVKDFLTMDKDELCKLIDTGNTKLLGT